MRCIKLALSNRSIPFWLSFAVFSSISTLVFGFCFAYLYPIAEIPSDDSVYGANLVAVSKCFSEPPINNPFCVPGPSIPGYAESVNYMKPVIGFIGGVVYKILEPFGSFSGVDILSLINFISLAVAISLMCASIATTHRLSSVLTFLIFISSVTTHGIAIWTGYSSLVLLILVLILILHSEPEKLPLNRQLTIGTLLSCLFFINLSTLPWIVGYLAIFTLQSYWLYRKDGKAGCYPLITTATTIVITILLVDWIAEHSGGVSYLNAYHTAYGLNVSGSGQTSGMIGLLTIPFYYLSTEPLLVTLFVVSSIACKSELITFLRHFRERLRHLLSKPYGMTVCVTLLAVFMIAVGPQSKQLRIFFPSLLGFCILLSLLVPSVFLKGKMVRIVATICLLASFQYSILDSFYQYRQRSPVPRVLEGFAKPSSNVFSFLDDPLIYTFSTKRTKHNSISGDFHLEPFYPVVADEHKEHYLALKFLTEDFDRFHLTGDQESALVSMGIGDFLLTSSTINDPRVGYVDSIKLIWDKMSSVNHWQSISASRRIIDSLLSGGFSVGFIHVIKHIIGTDLSDESFTLHIYQKCGSFEGYVNKYDDLFSDYSANSGGQSKNEWGKQHYCTHGINDGRTYGWLSVSSCLACN